MPVDSVSVVTSVLETPADTNDQADAADAADAAEAAEAAEAASGSDPTASTWWRQAVVYQIYPRSFADGNGDGVGDLRGIISRVDHLRRLGVDAVWLSPFYPSALADGGYDVDDYRAVAPELGSLDDIDTLVGELHRTGIKVIVDIVPNHTSNRHAWFREAVAAAPGSAARRRYVIRRGRGADGAEPATDWTSYFGGPAWEPLGDGDWYLHLFAPEQPDLNWADEEVRADFLKTLRFWADRGVDGFRVDVAQLLVKDASVISGLDGSLPTQAQLSAGGFADGEHPFQDRDEVHDIYRSWRAVFNEYDPPRMAVAEAWVPAHRRVRFASAEELGQAFNFDLLQTEWVAGAFRKVIDDNLALAREAEASSTWVLSNHDMVRHATRYALPNGTDLVAWLRDGGTDPAPDVARGLRRARAATLLALALPGSAYLYQGEELGLPEVTDLPAEVLQDPTFFRSGGAEKGRDGCRVPIPWRESGESFGFGSGSAHLPQPAWFGRYAMERELADPASTLRFYIAALAARRSLLAAEELTWRESPSDVVAFERPGGWVSVTNFGETGIPLPEGRVVIASEPLTGDEIPPETTVWLHTTKASA